GSCSAVGGGVEAFEKGRGNVQVRCCLINRRRVGLTLAAQPPPTARPGAAPAGVAGSAPPRQGMLEPAQIDEQRAEIMVFCETCGTENRDKARFCCGCARALAPVSSASGGVVSAPGPVQTCPAGQTV